MKIVTHTRSGDMDRREFLQWLGVGVIGLGLVHRGFVTVPERSAGTKRLRGIFPIAQTPFTAADKLDVDALVRQLEFIDRGGVHGFVWPQLASEWSTLTESERMVGMEGMKYLLVARGVFNTCSVRTPVSPGFSEATKVATARRRSLKRFGVETTVCQNDALTPDSTGA